MAHQPRYTLAGQLNFIADLPDRKDVVVTVQHWAKTSGTGAVYVVCYNGTEHTRRVCTDDKAVAQLVKLMAKYRTEHKDGLLSEEAAEVHVRRRNGPELTWCHRVSCGEPVPYAAATCADGHPTESVGRVAFASVTQISMAGQSRG
jgi:hypothetical protein